MSESDWQVLFGFLIFIGINVWRFLTMPPHWSDYIQKGTTDEYDKWERKEATRYAKAWKKRRKRRMK